MKEISEGKYSITMESLEGDFKFIADRSWDVSFGGDAEITGNGIVRLRTVGAPNLIAPKSLENVSILLDPEARTATFSGLPGDMTVAEKEEPKHVMEGKPFWYEYNPDASPQTRFMSKVDGGIYEYVIRSTGSEQFVITDGSVRFSNDWRESERWDYMQRYEYTAADPGIGGLEELTVGESVDLKLSTFSDAVWKVASAGVYRVVIDTDAMTLTVKEVEMDAVYICGDVSSESGVSQSSLAPTEANRETYDDYFRLNKIVVGSSEYYNGTFRIAPVKEGVEGPDGLPQFRFFRALLGWVNSASLGSAEQDFFAEPVSVASGFSSVPIVEGGLGNWGIQDVDKLEDGRLEVTVDLENMRLYFGDFLSELPNNGVEELELENSESKEVWFNSTGVMVNKPGKGLYIQVKGGKSQKVIR